MTSFGGPKLGEVDLAQGHVIRTIVFPADVALPTTYLNDVRVDLRRGPAANGAPQPYRTGVDGIALRADGARLFYSSLMGCRLYSVSTEALVDQAANDTAVVATIRDEGDKGGGGDGMESDAEGSLYTTNYEHNAILRRRPEGWYEPLAHGPYLLWPDTLALGWGRYLYVTVNQLRCGPRFHGGEDLRRRPYGLFRIRVDTSPVGDF
jgi:sugar lactone lactonase YvrE